VRAKKKFCRQKEIKKCSDPQKEGGNKNGAGLKKETKSKGSRGGKAKRKRQRKKRGKNKGCGNGHAWTRRGQELSPRGKEEIGEGGGGFLHGRAFGSLTRKGTCITRRCQEERGEGIWGRPRAGGKRRTKVHIKKKYGEGENQKGRGGGGKVNSEKGQRKKKQLNQERSEEMFQTTGGGGGKRKGGEEGGEGAKTETCGGRGWGKRIGHGTENNGGTQKEGH